MTALEYLLSELQSNRLEVVLIPEKRRTHEMGMIRCVVSRNPSWYRRLCAAHPSKRGVRRGKFDTAVRRANITRALERMIAGQPGGLYGDELRRIAKAEFRKVG